MIGAIRVRFPDTPASAVWNDTVFNNWLNTTIPFSLAHFWLKSSFGQADLRYQLFPPIVIDDPRSKMTEEEKKQWGKDREYLVNGVTAKITSDFRPMWGAFDALLIWFAQQTALFGGGAFPVSLGYLTNGGGLLELLTGGRFGMALPLGTKYLPVAVCDILSPFDTICQELGHSFDFEHPLDGTGNEYGDPYDSMASQTYGGKQSSFERPFNSSLPMAPVNGKDQQRIIGPLVSAAQIYNHSFANSLKNRRLFVEVPTSYLAGSSSFDLYALDNVVDLWPSQALPVLAVLPPALPNGDTHFLELRRSAEYDDGIKKNAADTSKPPAGIVIHSFNRDRNRVTYVDTLPLSDNLGDRDYHVFKANFAFRVNRIGRDLRSVNITVGGGDFWRHFGLNIEDVHTDMVDAGRGIWQKADVSPCFMFPVGSYAFRHKYTRNSYSIFVSSYGYEKPGYVWKINDTELDPRLDSVNIRLDVNIPHPNHGNLTTSVIVPFQYRADKNSLSLTCDPQIGNFDIRLGIQASETSPEVIKNFYEDQSTMTILSFDNISLEWDSDYMDRVHQCYEAIKSIGRRTIPIPVPTPPSPEPGPDWQILPSIEAVIRNLVNTNPAVANTVIDEVSRMANINKIDVIKRLDVGPR